jgi:Zn-dependent membrane protease YugP
MWLIDFRWFLLLAPAIILALYAQWKVKSTYARYAKVAASSGLTAAQVAERILGHGAVSLGKPDLRSVKIAAVSGTLSDHYDPRTKTLRLSKPESRSLADIGVAAHEAGHALQDAARYQPLVLRSALVPAARFGSQLAFPLILGGLFIPKLSILILLGILAYSAAVVFTLVTLPVEFNASRRAMVLLRETGVVSSGKELAAVGKVLSAAALTYVAAAAAAVLNLVYYLMLFLGGRR